MTAPRSILRGTPPLRSPAEPSPRRQDEEHIQFAVARVLDALGLRWAHPPNEALQRGDQASQAQRRASQAYGAKLVGLGVKAGLPDVLIFSRSPAWPEARGVALELKTLRGQASPDQARWIAGLEADGWRARVARGLDEALEAISEGGWDVAGALERLARMGWVRDGGRLVRASVAALAKGAR